MNKELHENYRTPKWFISYAMRPIMMQYIRMQQPMLAPVLIFQVALLPKKK